MRSRPVTGDVLALKLAIRDTNVAPRDFVRHAYEEHRDVIWRYLRSLGIGPDEAQELTQDIFIKLYEAIQRGQEIRVPRAWLFSVASRLAIDHHRAGSRRSGVVAEALTRDLHIRSRADADPEQAVLQREQTKALDEALRMLSPQQQICVHLRAEGLRYREIAQILGISIPAVAEFLRRAITRLRTILDE